MGTRIDKTASYDEEKAASEIDWRENENGERANYILSSNGRFYKTSYDKSEEETLKRLLQDNEPNGIARLWLKKAPKASGSDLVRRYFEEKHQKPVIHIGHVHICTGADRLALKGLISDGFQLEVWKMVSEKVRPSEYHKCLRKYLELLREEVSKHTKPRELSEDKVAIIACGEDGINHILTNTDRLYRSEPSEVAGKTVTEVMMLDKHNKDIITELWIKKAPEYTESQVLKNSFEDSIKKPVLYIGHIHKYTARDRQGLKDLITGGFELKVWENASQYVKPRYTECLQQYLNLLVQETVDYPEREADNYIETEVAIISCGEDRVTHLLTDKGDMYRNSYEKDQHAEVVLHVASERSKHAALDIKKIWVKNSPCSPCSKVLLDLFSNTIDKPVIYVGSIYNPEDEKDRRGLLSLLEAGFDIKVWGTMNTALYGKGNIESEKYLNSLREQIVTKKGSCSIL